MRLRKASGLCLAALLSTVALADSLVQTATLKDLQTVGSTSKKQKHQQYDLVVSQYVHPDLPFGDFVARHNKTLGKLDRGPNGPPDVELDGHRRSRDIPFGQRVQ